MDAWIGRELIALAERWENIAFQPTHHARRVRGIERLAASRVPGARDRLEKRLRRLHVLVRPPVFAGVDSIGEELLASRRICRAAAAETAGYLPRLSVFPCRRRNI